MAKYAYNGGGGHLVTYTATCHTHACIHILRSIWIGNYHSYYYIEFHYHDLMDGGRFVPAAALPGCGDGTGRGGRGRLSLTYLGRVALEYRQVELLQGRLFSHQRL